MSHSLTPRLRRGCLSQPAAKQVLGDGLHRLGQPAVGQPRPRLRALQWRTRAAQLEAPRAATVSLAESGSWPASGIPAPRCTAAVAAAAAVQWLWLWGARAACLCEPSQPAVEAAWAEQGQARGKLSSCKGALLKQVHRAAQTDSLNTRLAPAAEWSSCTPLAASPPAPLLAGCCARLHGQSERNPHFERWQCSFMPACAAS